MLGAYGRDELNDNGKRLLTFATDHKLTLTNTFFSTRKGGISHTSKGINSRDDHERIDYILTRQAHRPRVYDVTRTVHPQPPPPAKADSDHNIVDAMVRLSGRIVPDRHVRSKKQIRPFDRQKCRSDRDCRQLGAPDQAPRTSMLVIEAAGQRYRQATQFIYLGGLVNASADIMPEIKRRVRLAWEGCKRFQRELYDVEAAPFTLKVPMLKAEVIETLLYGCATWTLGKEDFAELRTAHHRFLLRIIGFQRQQRTHHHVVRQGPQEGTMRERRDHYPQTASPL